MYEWNRGIHKKEKTSVGWAGEGNILNLNSGKSSYSLVVYDDV